jgi:hypothetical protein
MSNTPYFDEYEQKRTLNILFSSKIKQYDDIKSQLTKQFCDVIFSLMEGKANIKDFTVEYSDHVDTKTINITIESR